MLEFISSGLALLEKLSPHFGKVTIKIRDVELTLDIPRVSDGEGGFNHGSRGSFSVEIINRKGVSIILEDIRCVAYCGDTVLQDNICCNDKETYRKVAMRPTYDAITSICIPSKEIKTCHIQIISNKDFSKCDRLALSYLQGRKRREITVYERLDEGSE